MRVVARGCRSCCDPTARRNVLKKHREVSSREIGADGEDDGLFAHRRSLRSRSVNGMCTRVIIFSLEAGAGPVLVGGRADARLAISEFHQKCCRCAGRSGRTIAGRVSALSAAHYGDGVREVRDEVRVAGTDCGTDGAHELRVQASAAVVARTERRARGIGAIIGSASKSSKQGCRMGRGAARRRASRTKIQPGPSSACRPGSWGRQLLVRESRTDDHWGSLAATGLAPGHLHERQRQGVGHGLLVRPNRYAAICVCQLSPFCGER